MDKSYTNEKRTSWIKESVHLVFGRYLPYSPFLALIMSFSQSPTVLRRVLKPLHGARFDPCCPTISCHPYLSFRFWNPAFQMPADVLGSSAYYTLPSSFHLGNPSATVISLGGLPGNPISGLGEGMLVTSSDSSFIAFITVMHNT